MYHVVPTLCIWTCSNTWSIVIQTAGYVGLADITSLFASMTVSNTKLLQARLPIHKNAMCQDTKLKCSNGWGAPTIRTPHQQHSFLNIIMMNSLLVSETGTKAPDVLLNSPGLQRKHEVSDKSTKPATIRSSEASKVWDIICNILK